MFPVGGDLPGNALLGKLPASRFQSRAACCQQGLAPLSLKELIVLKYTVSLTVILAAIWLLFSGMWTHPVIIPLGIASVALTVYLSRRMGIIDREGHPLHLLGPSLRYWPWLILEIVKSNFVVAGHILKGPKSINPRLSRVKASQKTELGRVIFANSITLTPGTVTIHVRNQEIWFYALTEEIERGVVEGDMNRRATEFEGEQ